MTLTFKQLEILNFMSFKEESFDFSSNKGINLICGINNDLPGSRNAAGKSNILNALSFSLYGKTINDIKKEHITNRLCSDKDECKVSQIVESNGISYRIERGLLGKARNKYCNLFKLNTETNVYEDITKSGIKETQKFIEKEILHCDMSLFLRSILLTSDQSYNFFKLKKEEKCKFIEQIFDLIIFGVMYDLLHKDVLKLDKEIYALCREIKIIQDQRDQTLIKKDEYDTKHQEKINVINVTLEQLKVKLIEFNSINTDYTETLNQYIKDKELNSNKITKLTEKQKEIQNIYHALDKEIEKLKLKINQNNVLINKHKETLKLLCSECYTKFDNLYKISELTSEITDFSTKLENSLKEKTKTSENYNKFTEAINTLQQKNSVIVKNQNDITSKNLIRERNIQKINMDISNNETLLKQLQNETNPHIDSLDKLIIKNDKLTDELSTLTNKVNHLKYEEKLISPEMIRKLIIKDLISYLNDRIQLYIGRMGAKFTCVFDENLYYTFYTESGETSYDNFSAGEKMRLSIATSFAFRDFMSTRSNISANILILDEYLDSNLDSLSILNLMNILKEFSISKHYDVYIVSHRKEVSDTYFNNIITVEKTNGISKINKELVDGMEKE